MARETTKRRDKDRIVLRKGEGQRPNGTYDYRWTDIYGKRHTVYAPTLDELREKEKQIARDVSTTLGIYADVTKDLRKDEFAQLDDFFKKKFETSDPQAS